MVATTATLKRFNLFICHLWDIKISKPQYEIFPKMVELCHFLWFLGFSEKNYSSQLLWITLYQELTIEQQTIGAWQLLDNYRWAWLPWEWAVKPPQNLPRGTTQGSPWKAAPRVATRDQTALARLTHDKHTHKQGDIFLCAYFRVFWQDSSKYVFSRCAVCMFSHGWIISKDVQCVF